MSTDTTPRGATFFQDPPRLTDEWDGDVALRRLLGRLLPADVLEAVTPDLADLGLRAATDLLDLHNTVNRRDREPTLTHFDAWGTRIDEVEVSDEFLACGAVGTEAGVVAAGHEGTFGQHDRINQFARTYLWSPSSALYSCPMAMTDGAATTLRALGDDDVIARAVPHLISRDPGSAWTSGQWMTERTGGSDVGISETIAVPVDGDGRTWRLYGTKWFTSAVTSQMALTLARPEGNPDGGRGLAMFYVEVRDEDGNLNDIEVLRLKDKLGTRQMPTAELKLNGTLAHLVGEPANGTRNIAPMLTITRIWNAVTAASGIRRAVALAEDYARRREAFGRLLVDQPLHRTTLAALKVQHEAALQLSFRAVELLGKEEAGVATEDESAGLRLLLPIMKLVTAKQAVAAASEALEAFGGAGYIEDTNLPALLRDAQVLPIWEGTTNVLSLDALRALQREDALSPFIEDVRRAATSTQDAGLAAIGKQAIEAAEHAATWVADGMSGPGIDAVQHGARRWAMTLGRSMQAALLAQQAQHDLDRGVRTTAAVARKFAADGLDLLQPAGEFAADDALLVRGE